MLLRCCKANFSLWSTFTSRMGSLTPRPPIMGTERRCVPVAVIMSQRLRYERFWNVSCASIIVSPFLRVSMYCIGGKYAVLRIIVVFKCVYMSLKKVSVSTFVFVVSLPLFLLCLCLCLCLSFCLANL